MAPTMMGAADHFELGQELTNRGGGGGADYENAACGLAVLAANGVFLRATPRLVSDWVSSKLTLQRGIWPKC